MRRRPPEAVDLEVALGTMDPTDAAICRWYLAEGRTFEEIGRELGGLHRSTVKRRFDRCLPAIRAALADYDDRQVTRALPGPETPLEAPYAAEA
jgi:DNA-directed RNA polymerase specialized sigma24 family protein